MDIRLKFVYPLKQYTAQKQWEEFPSKSWNKQSSWATKKFYIGVKQVYGLPTVCTVVFYRNRTK